MSENKYHHECPMCHGLPEDVRGGQSQYYGKVSEEEYNRLRSKIEAVQNLRSIGISYEIILNADKTLLLNLYAECDICHTKWEHQGVVK